MKCPIHKEEMLYTGRHYEYYCSECDRIYILALMWENPIEVTINNKKYLVRERVKK